jgi:hypothetical protein
MENTIAHETSHGILDFHIAYHDSRKRTPSNLALQVADLYVELGKTTQVPTPSKLFDERFPPPLKSSGASALKPAGHLIVYDTLWSGSGGHPWDNVDEFFASAYAAYVQQLPRLEKIIKHYSKIDPKLEQLGKRLIDLLGQVHDPRTYQALSRPSNAQKAEAEIARIEPPRKVTDDATLSPDFYEPTKMRSPDRILCTKP